MATVDCGHYVARPLDASSAVVVKAGSPFRRLVVLRPGEELAPLNIIASEGADVSVTVLVLPGVSADIDIKADLSGKGANVRLYGLYLCGGSEQVAIRTDIRHIVPETSSNQLFNGIAAGESRPSFHGRIVVAPDAQKTEAFQTNRNILLSDAARVETKPQLEIYADDVKCSHGATIGRLDEQEQFYMRSRGIPEAEAKVLQLISFLSPVLDGLAGSEKEELSALVEAELRKICS